MFDITKAEFFGDRVSPFLDGASFNFNCPAALIAD
jgi:hypothetical protein